MVYNGASVPWIISFKNFRFFTNISKILLSRNMYYIYMSFYSASVHVCCIKIHTEMTEISQKIRNCIILSSSFVIYLFLYMLFRKFSYFTLLSTLLAHFVMGSFVGRGNQYIQLVKILYCKLQTIGKQLQSFPHKVWGLNHRPQRCEASVTTAPPWPLKLSQSKINTSRSFWLRENNITYLILVKSLFLDS